MSVEARNSFVAYFMDTALGTVVSTWFVVFLSFDLIASS